MDNIEKMIRLESLISQREGMIWTNKQREIEGKSMAYDDTFFDIALKMEELLSS